jgi:CRP-like cAMP-binding protein
MASGRPSVTDVAAIGVFEGLGPEALYDCANIAVRRELPRGLVVFRQGEPCVRFQALLSGRVRISQAGQEGELALMRFVGKGEPFGSFGMFVDGNYPAEATTVEASVELSWTKPDFLELTNRHPTIIRNLVTVAARRLATLQERLREITTLTAKQRVASALLRLAQENSGGPALEPLAIPWPLTRNDVASISGTAVYTASRIMAAWERGGIIATVGKRISIRSAADLVNAGDTADVKADRRATQRP